MSSPSTLPVVPRRRQHEVGRRVHAIRKHPVREGRGDTILDADGAEVAAHLGEEKGVGGRENDDGGRCGG